MPPAAPQGASPATAADVPAGSLAPAVPPPAATATARPVLSAFGTAAVNGTVDPGEWDGASQLELLLRMPEADGGSVGSGRVPAVVSVMNDAANLYVAVQIGQIADGAAMWITFDNDNDGTAVEAGDDVVAVQRTEEVFSFYDAAWFPCTEGQGVAGAWCEPLDSTTGRGYPAAGTIDGTAGGARPVETQMFELSHPLDSGDARDVSLRPGSAVGIQVVLQLAERRNPSSFCDSGACGGGGIGYATIIVASPGAAPLGQGPIVSATASPAEPLTGWYTGRTSVRVAGVATTESPVAAVRVWGLPARLPWILWQPPGGLGGQVLSLTGNAAHRIWLDGITILHAYAVDRDGRLGPWLSLPVRIDTMPPAVSPPRIVFRDGGVVGGTPTSTLVRWIGTDAQSGVARYELQESVDGGPYRVVAAVNGATTAVARRPVLDAVYRYRIRATDTAGNVGRWIEGAPSRVSLVDSSDTRIDLAGRWETMADPEAIEGSLLVATDPGATARLTFDGSAVAVIVRSGVGLGVMQAALDESRLAGPRDVDLGSPVADARVGYRAEWSGTGRHVIELTVAGTSARPTVALDALLVATAVATPGSPAAGIPEASYEAETLGWRGDVTTFPLVQAMNRGFGAWSNGRQLSWFARVDETVRLNVPVTPGRWAVRVYAMNDTCAPTVRFWLEGAPLGPPVDLHADTVGLSGPIELGTTASSGSGVVGLFMSVVGSVDAACGSALVGLDRVVLTPAD